MSATTRFGHLGGGLLTATATLGTLGIVGLALWGIAATRRTDHSDQTMETAPS